MRTGEIRETGHDVMVNASDAGKKNGLHAFAYNPKFLLLNRAKNRNQTGDFRIANALLYRMRYSSYDLKSIISKLYIFRNIMNSVSITNKAIWAHSEPSDCRTSNNPSISDYYIAH